jgi:chemotaxis protein MotB
MTKLREETGEVISKPLKPQTQRRFPWRLWLYAIVITGAAGAGGYFAWHFREQAKTSTATAETCTAKLDKVNTDLTVASAAAAKCSTDLEATSKQGKDLEGKLAQASTSLDASQDELTTLRAQKAEQEKRLAAIENFQKEFAKMTSAGQVKVSARRGSLVLSLPSEVLFASGSADLSEKGTFAVVEIGATLKRLGSDRRFLVVGHTDDLPLKGGAFKDNWELSAARALTVTRTLVKAGMDAKNLIPAGAGENDPISKDRAKNRRIEIALLPAINELPPLPKSLTDEK